MKPPLVNGEAYSWSTVTLNLFNQVVAGIDAINYTEEEEMENNYGHGKFPVSRSYGNVSYEGSITLHMVEVERLQSAVTSGRLQDIPEFDIQVSFLPQNGVIVNHTLRNCRFMKNERSMSQNDKKIATELTLIIGEIKWN